MTTRNRNIIKRKEAGETLRHIAKEVNMTQEGVRQVIIKHNNMEKIRMLVPDYIPVNEDTIHLLTRILTAFGYSDERNVKWSAVEATSDYELSKMKHLGKKSLNFIREYQPDYVPNRQDQAIHLLQSLRGQYIVGQALYVAIKKLKRVPRDRREISNIADMELLLDEVFAMGKVCKYN